MSLAASANCEVLTPAMYKQTLLPPPRRICFHHCLSVCLLATLRKNFQTDLHEIFGEGWQLAMNNWSNFGGNFNHRLDT